MTKTEQLNLLFKNWETEIPEYKGKFIQDGINNEDLYLKAATKVLFLTKEPNNPNQEAGNNLQVIFHPVMHFLKQHLFFF